MSIFFLEKGANKNQISIFVESSLIDFGIENISKQVIYKVLF